MKYSPLKPTKRVILISGANRGIGRAIAERLHEEGYLLSLGARHVETLSPVTAMMKKGRVFTHSYDACKPNSANDWVAATIRRFKRIDGVVNNAGISPYFGIEDQNEELLDEMWTVNAKGPLRVIRAAFPHLKRSGVGRVVNIISLSGKRVGTEALAGYAMTKFAAMALTHAVRAAGWKHSVRATAICPGYVATDMTAEVSDFPRDKMLPPGAIAELVATVLALPNTASVAEIPIHCRLEASF